jgi:hypothetical protein
LEWRVGKWLLATRRDVLVHDSNNRGQEVKLDTMKYLRRKNLREMQKATRMGRHARIDMLQQ